MISASSRRWALAAALLLPALAAADVALPRLAARVTDQTGTLSVSQRDALEAKLAAFEAKKGSQLAVLLVPSTQPETIEQYSIRVVEQWKLGRQRVDDGVLLIVAKNDKRLRIEVGRGLEGAIPDATARRVIAEFITPHFKQGDFNAGINAGVDRIMALIEGEALPAPVWTAQTPASQSLLESIPGEFFLALLVAAFVGLAAVASALRRLLGRLGGAAAMGGAFGGAAWLLSGLLAVALLTAFVAFVFALVVAGSNAGRGWISGGGWSSGSSSGGGGGGFSGGGGSFGGGGSSGSW